MTSPEFVNRPPIEMVQAPAKARTSVAALSVALVWTVLALIFGSILLINAKDVTYGADAYTGIQNAIMLAVRGIAFLLFGSAALGIIIAASRVYRNITPAAFIDTFRNFTRAHLEELLAADAA
jgi:hypothetical protein